MYTVEAIVGKKIDRKTKQPMYMIKWEGYQSKQNTWEPLEHLAYLKPMIDEYEATLNGQDNATNSAQRAIDKSQSKQNSAQKSSLSARKSNSNKRLGLKLIKKNKEEQTKNDVKIRKRGVGKPRGRKRKQKQINQVQQKQIINKQNSDGECEESDSNDNMEIKKELNQENNEIQENQQSNKNESEPIEKSVSRKSQKIKRKKNANEIQNKQVSQNLQLLDQPKSNNQEMKIRRTSNKKKNKVDQDHSDNLIQQNNKSDIKQKENAITEKQNQANISNNHNFEEKPIKKKRGRKRKSQLNQLNKNDIKGEQQQKIKQQNQESKSKIIKKIIVNDRLKRRSGKQVRMRRRKNIQNTNKTQQQLPFQVIYGPSRKEGHNNDNLQQNPNESVRGQSMRSSNASQWRYLRENNERNNNIIGLRGLQPAQILGMRKIQDVLSFYVQIKNQRQWKSHDYMIQYYPRELCGFYQRNLVFQ